ncbi:MAG: hemerythrin domain-containing protein [Bacteroidetes bacterium]|nr:hemerythrin domain-containing protein [Bacteroidota bacterium]
MKNNPLDQLYEEHKIIAESEKRILDLNETWTSDPAQFKSSVENMLRFFQEYADGLHHRKEEEYLFPALINHPAFTLQEMIREFENHHDEFRNYIACIKEELNKQRWEAAYKLLRSYSLDLRDHIAAENEELFVLAENLLDENELEEMYFRFRDLEMELGDKKLAELEGMLRL